MGLIINADDFGYSKVFNAKMLDLIEKGATKSVTVLVDRLNAEQGEQVFRLKKQDDYKKVWSLGISCTPGRTLRLLAILT